VNGKYYAGWDGGGTKTTVVCLDENGKTLLRAEAGPFNSLGNVSEALDRAIKESLSYMEKLPGGLAGCGGLCIGGAGISSARVREDIAKSLSGHGFSAPYKLVSDYETAFYGVFGCTAGPGHAVGLALISGTGSVCYGRDEEGRAHRAGGWGHLIDDEGSGYAIGRDVLASAVRALDGRIKPTPLTDMVFAAWSISSAAEIVTRLYAPSTGKREIAALSPLCFAAAGKNDERALSIIDKAAEALYDLVYATAKELKISKSPVRAALMGGTLLNGDFLVDALRKRTSASDIRFDLFAAAEADAAMGAARMALL
jgi:N-acetylglucosamine kinase-like BadF-type ATPase